MTNDYGHVNWDATTTDLSGSISALSRRFIARIEIK